MNHKEKLFVKLNINIEFPKIINKNTKISFSQKDNINGIHSTKNNNSKNKVNCNIIISNPYKL